MAGFGFLYATLLDRGRAGDLVRLPGRHHPIAAARRGLKRRLYAALALGVYDISDEARAIDRKITRVLAAIGIPMACLLHGYVGFLFGSLKANPWWSTPLMSMIFLFSAMVSGIAVLIFLYQIAMKLNGWTIDRHAISSRPAGCGCS